MIFCQKGSGIRKKSAPNVMARTSFWPSQVAKLGPDPKFGSHPEYPFFGFFQKIPLGPKSARRHFL